MPRKSTSARVGRARLRQLDELLETLSVPARPAHGWVKTLREALGMTQKQLGRRLEMTPQGVSELERQESTGKINLDTLSKAAEQMGCGVQYVLVPKSTLNDVVERQARKRAREKLLGINASQSLEDARLSNEQMQRSVDDLANELKLERARDLWDEA